jgi:hypothetical protein
MDCPNGRVRGCAPPHRHRRKQRLDPFKPGFDLRQSFLEGFHDTAPPAILMCLILLRSPVTRLLPGSRGLPRVVIKGANKPSPKNEMVFRAACLIHKRRSGN